MQDDLSYAERPIRILEQDIKLLWNKEIPLVKILWQCHGEEEVMWELEEEIQRKYPELLIDSCENFENETLLRRGI